MSLTCKRMSSKSSTVVRTRFISVTIFKALEIGSVRNSYGVHFALLYVVSLIFVSQDLVGAVCLYSCLWLGQVSRSKLAQPSRHPFLLLDLIRMSESASDN